MVTKLAFKKATKEQVRLRMAIDGPSGSGKTYTALVSAFALADALGGRVALIDTEHASAAKYADIFPEFDVLELDDFSPETYTEAIQLADKLGYTVLIIDSLSHAWDGAGGALELVDKAATRGQSNNFTAWRDVTPMHRRMVETILHSDCHIIATMRSKMEYVLESVERGGKTVQVPKRVGMAPIQRQGMEYEFDIVADMDQDHHFSVSKSRCASVADLVLTKPKASWMEPVIAWLTSGEPIEQRHQEEEAAMAATQQQAPAVTLHRQATATAPKPVAEEHWLQNPESRERFLGWAWEKGLGGNDVRNALIVEELEDFTGSKAEAMQMVNRWFDEHSVPRTAPEQLTIE